MAGIESGDKGGDKLVREGTLPESRVVEAPGLSGAVLAIPLSPGLASRGGKLGKSVIVLVNPKTFLATKLIMS